jgi:N-acetylneuraminic acid mutarotase
MKTRASAIRGRKQTWSPQMIFGGILIFHLIVNLVLPLNSTAAPGWTSVAAMQTTRSGHTATLLADGRVLVAGGSNGDTLAGAEIYNPSTNTWTSVHGMQAARSGHSATLLADGRVLVVGGSNNPNADLYDPVTNTWSPAANLHTARSGHTATLLADGRVLVAGGRSVGGSVLASAEIYNSVTNTWIPVPNMGVGRCGHTATLLPDGRVLVAGGLNNPNVELYNPTANTWSPAANLSTARSDYTATLLADGRVLVAGGWSYEDPPLASAEIYDPTTNTWSPADNLNQWLYAHNATMLADGRVLITGGAVLFSVYYSVYRITEVYDPATNTWTSLADMHMARVGHTATLLADGRVLVAGGSDQLLSYLSSAEIYDPATGDWTAGAGGPGTWSHTATLLPDGRVLVAGGGNVLHPSSGSSLASAGIYDPTSNTWTAAAAMAAGRMGHSAKLLPGGRVLVMGGRSGGYENPPLASAEIYNPTANTWTAAAALPTAYSGYTATLLGDGRVLVAGGYNEPNYLPVAKIYDPTADTWTPAADMQNARFGHRATLLSNGRVLVTGGFNGVPLVGAEIYNPATNTWDPAADLLIARSGHTATLLPNGRVLVTGGNSPSITSAEVYDPATNTWTSAANLQAARASHTATLLPDGRVLVAGGESLVMNSSGEVYDPTTNTWTLVPDLGGMERTGHTATLLLDGRVMVAGGWVAFSRVDIFDRGLGYNSLWRPNITTIPTSLSLGSALTLSGSGFRGFKNNEASGGGTNNSATNYPLVQVRRLDNEQLAWLDPGTPFTATSFSSGPATQILPGPAVATVFVNGIPSLSRYLQIKNTNLFLPLILR